MQPILIGMTGRDAAGRALIADHLAREHGFHVISLERPFMQAAAIIVGIDEHEIPARMKSHAAILPGIKKHPNILMDETPTFASFVSFMRAEFCEEQHDDIIPQLLLTRIEALMSNEGQVCVVVTDLLYETEAAQVRSRGGVIFHVTNGDTSPYGSRRIDRPLKPQPEDRTITNTGTEADLMHQIDGVLARLRGFTGSPAYTPLLAEQPG